MATDTSIISTQTDIKQNFANGDNEVDAQDQILREKVRIWDKITRIDKDGTEVVVKLPFNTLLEPFYSNDDVDTSVTTAKYESANEYVRFYTDANGSYDTLQSKTISLLHNYRLYSITPTIYAYDTSDNLIENGFDLQIYNGNEWFNVNNGAEFILRDYNGADLDADLPAELSGYLLNYDADDNILFQNDIKYKIFRTTEDEIIVKKIIIKLNYLQELPLVSGWATMWGTWGTL